MHPQLETLLEIQDLKTQRRELDEASSREMQEAVFGLSTEQALSHLDAKIVQRLGTAMSQLRTVPVPDRLRLSTMDRSRYPPGLGCRGGSRIQGLRRNGIRRERLRGFTTTIRMRSGSRRPFTISSQ